ncbi:MAG TPA: hypothetical protein VGD64_07460 [Acidisarcina sp.]
MATIDERLDALAQSVELLTHDIRQTQEQLNAVVTHLDSVITAISTLAEISRSHERRIGNLEGS